MPTQLARQTKGVVKGEAGDEGPGCLWPLGAPSPREGEVPLQQQVMVGKDGACPPGPSAAAAKNPTSMASPSRLPPRPSAATFGPRASLYQLGVVCLHTLHGCSLLYSLFLGLIQSWLIHSYTTCPPSSSTPAALRLLSRSIILKRPYILSPELHIHLYTCLLYIWPWVPPTHWFNVSTTP